MENKLRSVCLTFDVDYTDYHSGNEYDEMTLAFPQIQKIFLEYPQLKTTWFIRIDSQIEALFGRADHILKKHEQEIEWLINNGHEIGWHHHSYKMGDAGWVQETEEEKICDQILLYGKRARSFKLTSARMGWGFHTNKTMKLISDLGFTADSSAIPRPKYKWENIERDWSTTPQHPYFPGEMDYRRSELNNLPILEVPISTVSLSIAGDTEENVMRYINPGYHPTKFKEAVEKLSTDCLVAISHPYELIESATTSSLISFKSEEFRKNLFYLMEKGCSFSTINELLANFKNSTTSNL